MNTTTQASTNSHTLGLVPKDLKQFKKLLSLSKTTDSGRGHGLPVTVSIISAGFTMLNLSNAQLKQSHSELVYKGQNVLNKRALIGLLKPHCNNANSNAFWQVRGTALSVTSFSGNLTLSLGSSNSCHKASKMRLCYQIAQQIHKIHADAHIGHLSKSPYNLLGVLVISKNHKWFIDSTELKQSLMLQENFADPRIALKQLTSTSKRGAYQKTQAKLTLRLFEVNYAKYIQQSSSIII